VPLLEGAVVVEAASNIALEDRRPNNRPRLRVERFDEQVLSLAARARRLWPAHGVTGRRMSPSRAQALVALAM